MKCKILVIILIILMIIGLSACAKSAVNNENHYSTGTVTAIETLYIGALLPDAENSEKSKDLQIAMEIAVDIINNPHDIDWDIAQNAGLANYGNAKVSVEVRDCGSTSKTATAATSEMIDLGIPLIIGADKSTLTEAVAKTCALNGVPMINGSTNDLVLTDEDNTYNDIFNRISSPDSADTELFLDYINQLNLTKEAGIKKVAIAYINNDYGLETAQLLEENIKKTNLEIVALIPYLSGEENFNEQASKMIINEPDAIFQISSTDDLIAFSTFYADANYQPKIILCYGSGFENTDFAEHLQAAGLDFYLGAMIRPDFAYQAPQADEEEEISLITEENEETLIIEAQLIDDDEPEEDTAITIGNKNKDEQEELSPQETRERATTIFNYINNLYQERAGKPMSNAALLEFSSVIVAAQAVDLAGTTNSEALITILKQTEFPAPYLYSSSITFDEEGQNTKTPSYISAIIDGKYTYIYAQENPIVTPASKQKIEDTNAPAIDTKEK